MSIRRILLLFLLLTPQVAGAESDDERQLFDFLNVERQRESLPSLQWEDELHDIAAKHSKEMAEQRQISHTGEGGTQPNDRVRAAGIYSTKVSGECGP